MRPVSVLITKIRQATDNQNYNATSGIQDNEILEYLNDAQDRIFSLLMKAYDNIYLEEELVDVANGDEYVDVPLKTYLGYRIVKVEFKSPGDTRYCTLKKGALSERFNGNGGMPSYYIPLDKQIILNPKTNRAGTVRFTYQRRIPTLDVLRGTISAVVLTPTAITSMTVLAPSLTAVQADNIAEIVNSGYMSVTDLDGLQQMVNIPVSSINSMTGAVSVRAGFTFQPGETAALTNWVTSGRNSSFVSHLPDDAERYLRSYAAWKLFKRDSSDDSKEQTQELAAMEQDIVESFAQSNMDADYPPIVDTQFLYSEGY